MLDLYDKYGVDEKPPFVDPEGASLYLCLRIVDDQAFAEAVGWDADLTPEAL